MNKRFLEELIKREERPNLAINMIAKRVRQLFRGDKPLVEDHHLVDPVEIAIKEFLDGKLEVKKQQESKI